MMELSAGTCMIACIALTDQLLSIQMECSIGIKMGYYIEPMVLLQSIQVAIRSGTLMDGYTHSIVGLIRSMLVKKNEPSWC